MLINSAILTSERPIELKAATPSNKISGNFKDSSEYQVAVSKYYVRHAGEYRYNYHDVKDRIV